MKMQLKALLFAALLAVGAAYAQQPADPPNQMQLRMATGEAKKGYSKLFANISTVCGPEVPLLELNTNGGLENLGVLADKKAMLGLVPIDIYQSMKKTDDNIGALRAVMSLNSNLLHIVVKQEGFQVQDGQECSGVQVAGKCAGSWKPIMKQKVVQNVEDLKGLKVALVGSAQLLARTYFNTQLGYNITPVDVDPDAKAFEMLSKGEVQAVMTMAAYPAGGVAAITADKKFTLVNFNLAPGGPYKVAKKNYKNLGVYGYNFLSVSNMLMVRPVDPTGEAGQRVTKLRDCITANIRRLQDEDGFEPSWSDATNLAVPEGVPAWTGSTRTVAAEAKRLKK